MHLPFCCRALLFAAALTAATSARADNGKCEDVEGEFTSVAVDGPSPVGINTLGVLTGNLKDATYFFVMLTLVPNPADPATLLYTGESRITLKNGKELFGEDTGFLVPGPDGLAPFETTVNIVGGTGKYQSGQIVASGVLDLTTGDAAGVYQGEVCKDK
jgi:hypothetical protein